VIAVEIRVFLVVSRPFWYMFQFDSKSVYLGERDQFLIDFSSGHRAEKGQIYFSVDLPDNPGAEDSIAEKLWRAYSDTFFNCTADDAFLCFEEALKAVNVVITAEGKKREGGTIGRVNGAALVLSGNTLHFSQTGLSELFLLRKGHMSRISEEAGDEPQQSFIEIASGEMIEDDRIVMSTRPLRAASSDLLETASVDAKKLLTKLRSFGKQQAMDGVLSVLVLQNAQQPEPVTNEEDVSFDTIEVEESQIPSSTGGQSRLSFLRSRIDIAKLKDAGKMAGGAFRGFSSKMSGLVRSPSSVSNVNKRYVMVGIIFVVIVFGFFITAQSSIREEQQLAEGYQMTLKDIRSKISIAEQRYLIGEKADAHEFLTTASAQLQEIEQSGFFKTEVSQLNAEVSLYKDSFDAIVRIQEPFVLADLSVKGNVDALGLIHTKEDKNFVYEPNRMFETILEKVQDPQMIDSESVVLAGWDFEDNNSLVFLSQDGRVLEYKDGRFEFVGTSDSAWKRGIDLKSFNRFIYVLDNSEGVIWKYPRLRTTYGSAIQYNSDGDLRDAVSITIDGNIYVLKRGGEILKLNKGKLQEFSIKDQPKKPMKNPTRIFTHTEALNLYVLDPESSRVVVYSKDDGGVSRYQKQFLFENVQANELRDLYVDQNEQKLYVLTKDKIYLTDL
jgi:hypothetical protein